MRDISRRDTRTLVLNENHIFSEHELDVLNNHEIGVHMVTTMNGLEHPLKIFAHGFPNYEETQEGLAVFAEYMSNNLTVRRLKELAYRVLAVDSLAKGYDFSKTFRLLHNQFDLEREQAFYISLRVHRGGGFTKDYLYLQGLHQMLNAYETRPDFNNLLSGKVSIEHLSVITGLINKGYLLKPELISPAIAHPQDNDAIQKFITHAIK